jgi:hydrogenase 3 maturation protease
VLGVGSPLRGDDAAGVLAAQMLEKALAESAPSAEVAVFHGYTAPENLTGEIKRFKPTHLLILDAADVGRKPGHIELIDPDVVTHNASASTHALPFSVFAAYLRASFPCDVVILGIQPAGHDFGEKMSPAVAKAAEELCTLILAALGRSLR